KKAVEKGNIQVNSQNASPDTVLRHNDLVTHQLHRHEPPVSDTPISILAESNDWIVINKPPGIPVHPSGRYHYNSILWLLRIEKNIQAVAIHRLDRLVSLVMLRSKKWR
ncbi:RNA pseudouridylate synthase domain containing protein 2, partial [Coelomomyces lativittatus]